MPIKQGFPKSPSFHNIIAIVTSFSAIIMAKVTKWTDKEIVLIYGKNFIAIERRSKVTFSIANANFLVGHRTTRVSRNP